MKKMKGVVAVFAAAMLIGFASGASAFGYYANCETWQNGIAPLPVSKAVYQPLSFWFSADELEQVLFRVDQIEMSVDGDESIEGLVVDGVTYKVGNDNKVRLKRNPSTEFSQILNIAIGLSIADAKRAREGIVQITVTKVKGVALDLRTGRQQKFETGDATTVELSESCTPLYALPAALQADISPMTTQPGNIGPLAKVKLSTETGGIVVRALRLYLWQTESGVGCTFDNVAYVVNGVTYAGDAARNVVWAISPGHPIEVTLVGRPVPMAPGVCGGPNYMVYFGDAIFTIETSKTPRQPHNSRHVIWLPSSRQCASPLYGYCSDGGKG